MSLPSPPSSVLQYIQEAAKGTGLPESVVAAQNYAESGYGTNLGPSSAGALGPWQFEPGTYTGLGFAAGTENDWGTSTQAYIKYMKQLLSEEHGNVRNALAAYNAGPGNIGAGYGYADSILSNAGQSSSITASTSAGTSAGIGIPGLSGITSSFSTIAGAFKDIDTILTDILNPSFWLRVGAFIAGVFFLVAGVWCLIHASDGGSILPPVIPVPI